MRGGEARRSTPRRHAATRSRRPHTSHHLKVFSVSVFCFSVFLFLFFFLCVRDIDSSSSFISFVCLRTYTLRTYLAYVRTYRELIVISLILRYTQYCTRVCYVFGNETTMHFTLFFVFRCLRSLFYMVHTLILSRRRHASYVRT